MMSELAIGQGTQSQSTAGSPKKDRNGLMGVKGRLEGIRRLKRLFEPSASHHPQ
jgi:hypothetical protein